MTVFSRMGGPAAWKEMQRKKGEWNGEGFGVDEARTNDNDDGERGDGYHQGYDIEVDKSKDTDEEASDEDVRPTSPPQIAALKAKSTMYRDLLWI